MKETAAAMLILSLLWLFLINYSMTVRQVELAGAFFLIRLLVIWFYWVGRNEARICVFLYSVFALIRVLEVNYVNGLTRQLWLGEAALGTLLLFYVHRRDVNAWFTRHQPAASRGPVPVAQTEPRMD